LFPKLVTVEVLRQREQVIQDPQGEMDQKDEKESTVCLDPVDHQENEDQWGVMGS